VYFKDACFRYGTHNLNQTQAILRGGVTVTMMQKWSLRAVLRGGVRSNVNCRFFRKMV